MLKELNIDDTNLIKDLEKTFKETFVNHPIKEDLINNPFSKYLVYINEGEVVGFINYAYLYDRIEIINISVKETFRRNKIGSRLLAKVLENKVINTTLEVSKNNIPAINLYRKYGFKEVAIRRNYYNGIDGILMERVD